MRGLALDRLHGRLRRDVLEPLHRFDGHGAGRHVHTERSGLVEQPVAGAAHPGVRVHRRVVLAVRRGEMNARRGRLTGRRVDRPHGEDAHRPLPAALGHRNLPERAPVRLEQLELRQAALVGDERDPLAVRRPARMKGIVLEEGQLVRLAARGRLHVHVVELVRRASGRGVDEALAVERDVRPRAIQRLFRQHGRRLVDPVRGRGHAQHVAGAKRRVPVRDQEQLGAAGQPGRRDVHVHPAEVQTIAPEIAVARHRDLVARELAVRDRPDEHVEVSVRLRGHVGEARPVRREDRVHVDLRVGRERAAFAGRDVHDLQLDRGSAIVGDVGNPAPVGRPVGHRVIFAVVGELARAARGAVDDPDRTAHRDRQRRAVRRPRGSPGRRAGRRREVVVVHVVPALLRGGIRDACPVRPGGR